MVQAVRPFLMNLVKCWGLQPSSSGKGRISTSRFLVRLFGLLSFQGPSRTNLPGKLRLGEPAITLNHSPNEPNDSALIFKLDRALSAHNWATVSTYVADGVIDYFGHRNASRADLETEQLLLPPRQLSTLPDLA
jgi:hypothetical protein